MKNIFIKTVFLFVTFCYSKIMAQTPLIEWQKCLGGTGAEANYIPSIVRQTKDGGYITATQT